MATEINAGRVAMVPKGEWSASTAYTRLDVVQYNGSSYVASQDSTGQNPSTATTYWQLLASGVDPSNYYTKNETNTKLGSKQDALVSGQNIKTVNGQSVLGAGNLELGELFVVTMTRHNSVYTADKSVSEIYAASYTNGKPVIAVMRDISNPVLILTDCNPDGDSYVFSAIESNTVTTLRWKRTDDYTYELETMVLQPHLVSGTSIKTVNNESLLGGGNVDIVGKSAYQSYVDTTADSPVKTEAEWVASLKGEDGVSLGEVAVADNLTTDDGTKVLSARQGYLLGQKVNVVDDVPTAGSEKFVKSGGVQNELALGAVYDVSVKNPTAGQNNDGKFESLSALLSDANLNTLIPTAYRKGGMSIKFVQSSDNKYVQYRLMSDEFTTDTTQWAIEEEGVYVENPEFVYVHTDKDDKILWAIKTDGSIYYGAGCPQQVKDYIEERISDLSLDEYEDIVAFLSDYLGSDTTLKVIIDGINATKLDKEGLDPDALRTVQAVENHEYIQVATDNEDKILEAITSKGVKQINIPIETPAAILQNIESPDYIEAETDKEERIISCRDKDGTLHENVGIKTPTLAANSASFNGANVENLNVNTATIAILNISDSSKENITNTILTKEKEQEFSLLFGQTTGQVESFIFFSDPHYFSNSGGGYDNCVLRSGALSYLHRMRDYFINTPTDFILCGGDWLEDHKQSVAIKDLGWIDGFMNKTFEGKYYPIFGNHDNNYQGELDETTDHAANDGVIADKVVTNLLFRKYHEMYYKFRGVSTTFYIFNSGIDWNASMNEYRWQQVDWFGEKLLTNEGEHIIIGIHIVTNSGMVFGENITALANNITLVANAFNNRTSITLNDKTYNFANAIGKVHCALCGHVHYDGMAMVNNIPVMAIDDAMGGNFDLVLVDYGDNVLKTIRVGTGTNRIMNLV